jgi:hypothetical protein
MFHLLKKYFEMLNDYQYFAFQLCCNTMNQQSLGVSMKQGIISFFLIICFLLFETAYSSPRFAVRLGNKCADCHYNPTGGIIRNEDGWNYGKNILSAISPRDQDFLVSPKIGENITLGLDYRTQFLYSSEKQRADFQQMTGSIYTNVALAQEINLIARYDFIWNIWEAYGVANILPGNGYIKVGSFEPYFGIRIDDHTAYTRGGDMYLLSTGGRNGLIYNPLYREVGAEVGYQFGDLAFLTASAGSNTTAGTFSKNPTYTTRLELDPNIGKVNLMFGGSYASAELTQVTSGGPAAVPADFYGFFTGIGYKRFSLLAEFDMGNKVSSDSTKSNYAMAELSYVLTLGLDAVVRYDRVDPNTDISNDELEHIILGFEWFPYSFIEIRPQYRFILEDPNVSNDAVVIQFHFWY